MLWYPITSKTYNTFYYELYGMEVLTVMYSVYGLVVFDLFLIAILEVLLTHYEIILASYENFYSRNEDGEFILIL